MAYKKTVFLSIGSNLGNRHEHIINACIFISDSIGEIVQESNIYESAPWGNIEQPPFLNQVLEVGTPLYPHSILEGLKEYERENGRTTKGDWKARTIDIDILFYDQISIDEKNLSIPHPLIPQRKFVLIPLCEIAPLYNHVALGQSIQELLLSCKDVNHVQLWNPNDEMIEEE